MREETTKTIRVTFEMEVPDSVTLDQARDWIAFELNAECFIPDENPLYGRDIEADIISVQEV